MRSATEGEEQVRDAQEEWDLRPKDRKRLPLTLMIEISDIEDPTSDYSISAPEAELPDDDFLFIVLQKIAADIRKDLGVEH